MLNFSKLEQEIKRQMQEAKIPGLALAIVRGQEVIYAQGFGVTSVEEGGVPVTPGTLFRIGSVTKPLTGTAVMRLVESGVLDLDAPVKKYVPWLKFSEPGAAEGITLRMLMSHTAGLPHVSHENDPFGRCDPGGLEAHMRERMPHYPMIAPPGKVYSYGNADIDLVGYVAERVSGKPYPQLMQELVFDPLEMRHTTFEPHVAMTYPLAQAHDLAEDGTLRVLHRFADNSTQYPSGFAISTVLDLARFAILHLNQGVFRGQRILSSESVAEMHQTQADMYTIAHAGYGLTFASRTYNGIRCVGHGGVLTTYRSYFILAPSRGTAVILLSNRRDPGLLLEPLAHNILHRVLNLPKQVAIPEAVEPDRALWPRYVGSYVGNRTGLAAIQTVKDQLILELNGHRVPLRALRQDLYFGQRSGSAEMVSVGFIPERRGQTQFIMVDGSPCQRLQSDAAFVPDPTMWKAYVGTYTRRVGYLDTLRVRMDGDHLFVHSKELSREVACIPLGNVRFACDLGLIEFHMDNQGRVPALRLRSTYTLPREEE